MARNPVHPQASQTPLTLDDLKAQIREFYEGLTDPSQRLAIAAYEGDTAYALEAIAQGADVNVIHEGTQMPAMHLAAAGGARDLITAILETGKCDLTVRDPMGRLPSDCAAYSADDLGMAEVLAEHEGRQFRDKGKDPRRSAAAKDAP